MTFFYKQIIALFLLIAFTLPQFAVDEYFRFPEQSSAESVTFETKRRICLFPFEMKTEDATLQYLQKGIPSVILTGLRDLEYVFVEDLNPKIVYHSFGPSPKTTLQERIDAEGELYKKKIRPIKNFNDLEDLKKGTKILPAEKDPRFLPLKVVEYFEEPPPSINRVGMLASKKDCDYIIIGEISIQSAKLSADIVLYQSWTGKISKYRHESSVNRAYQEMQPLVNEIKKSLHGRETGFVTAENTVEGTPPLIYINGVFIGKPPFAKKEFIEGKYELFVFKEGYEPFKSVIEIKKGKETALSYSLTKIPNFALLSVQSNIEDAEVYLGIQYLGKTPLNSIAIPAGRNRLRVSKEGFVDSFRGIDAKSGEESSFKIDLKAGDTEIYYNTKQNVFLEYTYKDFATYSLYSTLFFYAGYLYFNVASRRAIEAARPQVAITNAAAIDSFFKSNPTDFVGWIYYQNSIISDAEAKARQYKDIAGTLPIENRRNRQLVSGGMVVGIGLALSAAFAFFVLGLDTESFDIGFTPLPSGGGIGNPVDPYSFMQFNQRF